MPNQALAFGALVAGAIVIDYGVKNAKSALNNPTAGGSGGATTATGSGVPQVIGKFPASVDPLPDSVGTALDQGIDGTGKTFLSPWAGKVVVANAHDSGWQGGGYVAVQSTSDPSHVWYQSEGLVPIVHVGDMVAAGEKIALPIASPYNGIVGNFEAGLANPAAPGQPLAQVISNPAGMVTEMFNWLKQLGNPHLAAASSDSSRLGHA